MLMSEKPKQSARHSVNIVVQTTQTGRVRRALVMEQKRHSRVQIFWIAQLPKANPLGGCMGCRFC